MFIRRDRRGPDRFLWWRVGLTLLAAGTWFGGVATGLAPARWVAIGLLVFVLLLGFAGR
ncbi:MAG TPA: hypothetical protein VFL93_10575 [Longimicrobiaceae bacterium]|nr:hypothetical protein [Longimicrobiaceae bacterium]